MRAVATKPPQKDNKVEALKPLPSTWFFSDSYITFYIDHLNALV